MPQPSWPIEWLRSMPEGATPTRKLDSERLDGCSMRTTQLWTSVLEYSRSPRTVAWPRKASSAPGLRLAVVPSALTLSQGDALRGFHLSDCARSRNMLLLWSVMESMMLSRDT